MECCTMFWQSTLVLNAAESYDLHSLNSSSLVWLILKKELFSSQGQVSFIFSLRLSAFAAKIWGNALCLLSATTAGVRSLISDQPFSGWKPSCGSLSDMGIKALFTPLQRVFGLALSLSIVGRPPTEEASLEVLQFVPSNKVSLELYYLKKKNRHFAYIYRQ